MGAGKSRAEHEGVCVVFAYLIKRLSEPHFGKRGPCDDRRRFRSGYVVFGQKVSERVASHGNARLIKRKHAAIIALCGRYVGYFYNVVYRRIKSARHRLFKKLRHLVSLCRSIVIIKLSFLYKALIFGVENVFFVPFAVFFGNVFAGVDCTCA